MEKSVSDSSGDRATAAQTSQTPRAFLDSLVTRLPEPAVVVDTELRVLAANDHLYTLVETPAETVLSRSLPDLFPAATRGRIEANCAQTGEYVTTCCQTVEDDRWVDLAFERHESEGETVYLGIGHDVTERQDRERTLEAYERIVETIEDGVYTLDDTATIRTVNDAMSSITGYDRETMVGSDASLLADESAIDRAATLSRQLRDGDRDVATMTTELQTADTGTVPVETRFSAYSIDDDHYRQVGVVRDVSDRQQFARMLAALHDTTRQLLRAETKDDVATVITETAADVLDLSGATVYLFDRSENHLRPTAVGPDATVDETDLSPIGPDGGLVWDVFVDDEGVTLGTGAIYRSLTDHGVFYAQTPSDGLDERTRELVDLLASSAEAALARVDREMALREREEERRQQNEELRQLKEVNAIIRRVDRALVEADTCEAIEQAVCDELASSQWFSFAWVGRSTEAGVEPRAWAGRSSSYLDAVTQSAASDGGPPAVQTARTGTPTLVPCITDDLRREHWRTEAISRDFRSAISVPLAYDDFLYGVLTVYADRTEHFGEMLESVFVELGESIANAMREIASRQRHLGDDVVELALSVPAPKPFTTQLARRLDQPITCEGVVPGEADTTRLFVSVPDVEQTTVAETIAEIRRVNSVSSVSEGLYEVVVEGDTVVRAVTDQGARLGGLEARSDRVDVVVHLASEVDVRTFVEQLESRYADVTLNARREKTTRRPNHGSIRAALEEKLTDRQLEVLQTAYLSGFFDWPRETTGEEVASMLDITQPTVNRHLRVSERKLLELVLGDG
ncbi:MULTISPECIES: bacterio-opsin activator domain-containing protein [Haloarcula]|uniref:XRE family transcriptional regulator n=1 Tax=Haloarcula pellucida TaxID=1427151 RepID=A0A830GQQ0_9EURY|nr:MULTISPECIES: bacterio-opsin activator domain-containing protein [Halomicroarcula]MBX0350358.1 PAS domain S-box protein [Halomicroarcula pellucida]MDS0277541.1 PAS domain S-box protein [Halomicroarcula sp. S1AR25-4]GGO01674.1 XRE family transcriptional regulator [Halomicroarcula pellucida]